LRERGIKSLPALASPYPEARARIKVEDSSRGEVDAVKEI
jgi:hypothetical protein